ncbi:MAG: CinA family nicotinamide mononucleotide deamidase-related protein [Bacteriovorax sp.]|nr:CinA family nicotinamide mononucleotide deamidase-related protein [Bacteriovorax sp.]
MSSSSENILSVSMIVIGDEILNGRTTDLNGSWLSKFLFKRGLELTSLRFIRDNIEEINNALKAAMDESDVVITSGGIGPTVDDKTKSTLANFFGKKLIERDDVAEIVSENYIRFGRIWNRESNFYHFFPEGFIGIKNPKGLAPGIGHYSSDKKLIMAAPGVPREFMAMVDEEFYPMIKKHFSGRLKENFQTVIRTQGVAEEKIFFELCPNLWSQLEAFGKVSSLPHTIGIDIVVSYQGNSEIHEEKNEQIKKIIMSTPIAANVWQWGNSPVNELVLQKAKDKKVTFAFAESCTGGLTSSKITDLPGSSEVFYGSVISYDNSIKENVLGVKSETLKKFGAVSIETAIEMAEGLLKAFKTDYAISTTGIAGPTGGTAEKPVGTVAIGYASKNKSGAYLFQFPGDRVRLKERFSDKALLTLLELME